MKKIIFLTFAFLFIFSCNRDNDDSEDSQKECKIVTAKTHNYLFDDVEISTASFDVNFTKFTFEYDSQKRVSKVNGSLIVSSAGTLFSGYYLSGSAYDEISYLGSTVYVKVSANMTNRPYDKEFVIENGKILSQKVASKFPFTNSEPINYTYEYSGNQILEKFNGILNNRINKTFTLENGNLSKVVKWKYDSDGYINGKTETIYSDYDTQENLLKDKFFINGAFYMAFSKNIYNKIDSKSYNFENGVFVQNGNYFNTTYNSTLTSNYFEKNCN